MQSDIKPGLTYELTEVVTDKNTAAILGSGTLPVFGTPRMLAMMEGAAVFAVQDFLEKGYTTVGTKVNLEHVAPSVQGVSVRAIATLTEVDGRRLVYKVEAYSGDRRIGFGTHERFIVNEEHFMERAAISKKEMNI